MAKKSTKKLSSGSPALTLHQCIEIQCSHHAHDEIASDRTLSRSKPRLEHGPESKSLFVCSPSEPEVRVTRQESPGSKTPIWELTVTGEALHIHEGRPCENHSLISIDALGKAVKKRKPKPRAGYRPPTSDSNLIPRSVLRRATIPHRRSGDLITSGSMLTASELIDQSYPWSSIGRVIVTETQNFGSGALVAENILLTASHLVPWRLLNSGQPFSMQFAPGFREGIAPFGTANVIDVLGFPNTTDVTSYDFAVCRLDAPLGLSAGYLGIHFFDNVQGYLGAACQSAGYPQRHFNGLRPMVDNSVVVRNVDLSESVNLQVNGRLVSSVELITDEFNTPGWSGGPLLSAFGAEDVRALAVQSGMEGLNSPSGFIPRDNVFAGGPAMVRLIELALERWS